MKYGILGGTFDPPHVGHMQVAKAALAELGLDDVVWVPANRNPLKVGDQTSPKARLHMCGLAITGEEGMSVSDIEITRGGPSYLVETLRELRMVRRGEYWFIAGADAMSRFETWKEPGRIVQMCRIALASRAGTDMEGLRSRLGPELLHRIDLLSADVRRVSSSNIRDMVYGGDDVSHLVCAAVAEYIEEKELYRDQQEH
ncbi:MAG: nicotinate (nicotinamide) nucleotide adenylyltransferase [Armatimonadetes bacterium]|nr:nicotinate (nicotinamide) nucleotide adenylyltransferase [Armatimonadota bacterium]